MVFVKVRETYDLKTIQNKMTVISVHTPKPDILIRNYPGLLMQCRAYRPVSADVRVACASVLPVDPLGIGTETGDVAPEDMFNPILYKAMSNKGMSQLEARINQMTLGGGGTNDVVGPSADVDSDNLTSITDEFDLYYGLLAETHQWKHANVQSGFQMTGLRPIVYDLLYSVGDTNETVGDSTLPGKFSYPNSDGTSQAGQSRHLLGHPREMPFINCTAYTGGSNGLAQPGFVGSYPAQHEQTVPYVPVVVGAVIVPPSRLHSLYFRMVIEWTIEFSKIRPIGEITDWAGIASIGANTHYQNYSYPSAKKAITGDEESMLDNDATMVSSNAELTQVM